MTVELRDLIAIGAQLITIGGAALALYRRLGAIDLKIAEQNGSVGKALAQLDGKITVVDTKLDAHDAKDEAVVSELRAAIRRRRR